MTAEEKIYRVTLDIDQKRISYAHDTKVSDDVPRPKQIPPPANKTSSDALDCVHEHIMSFPKVESHYRRSKTFRKYLDGSLNWRKNVQTL